jgi:hypothetical protein
MEDEQNGKFNEFDKFKKYDIIFLKSRKELAE